MDEKRCVTVARKTGETDITIKLNLDGSGKARIQTGIGFFDHMLNSFARHGLFDLEVDVKGDLEVDSHHTIEDTGIVLGQAILEAVGDKKGFCFLWTKYDNNKKISYYKKERKSNKSLQN